MRITSDSVVMQERGEGERKRGGEERDEGIREMVDE